MKTEIIIPTRGEDPKILWATVEQASAAAPVCVVYDGEQAQGLPCREIEKEWGGPGKARDAGIMSSDADLIVLMDAHMILPDRWLDSIVRAHKKNDGLLTCCRMEAMHKNGRSYGEPIQGGAQLWLDVKRNTMQLPIAADWYEQPRTRGRISCIMGACYALRRSWYSRMHRPLFNIRGWGWEEEMLSVTTHLYGGEVRLLSQIVGHIFDAPPRDKRMSEEMKADYASMSRMIAHTVGTGAWTREKLFQSGVIKSKEQN